MKILALDTSGLTASVAVVTEDTLLASYKIEHKKTHSQTLLPMLDEICKMIELDLNDIDAIAIAKGPGSFTGLRIGSATTKGLAMALGKPIVEIKTVEGLAYQLFGVEGLICPIMDARRGQVYTGLYRFVRKADRYQFETVMDQVPMSMEEMIHILNKRLEHVVFLGDGVSVHKQFIDESMVVPYEFAPAHCNRQNAAAIGTLAIEYFEQGKTVDADSHEPEYLRLSQAEREKLEKVNVK